MDNSKVDTMLSRNNHLMLSSVFLEFDDQVEWDVTALSKDWALWMSQNQRVPTMSKVGIMSSLRFQQLLNPWIPTKLGSYFRLMMHTSSIVYNHGPKDCYCGISFENFYALRSHAGTNLLIGLEDLLRPAELAKAPMEKLRAIFLILFGTILAVLYNERLDHDVVKLVYLILHQTLKLMSDNTEQLYPRGHVQRASTEEFYQLQDQLVQVLAHRLIELADRLALLESGVSKQLLVNSARQKWHLPATFAWEDSELPHVSVATADNHQLCGGQIKDLEMSCDFYSFDSSFGTKKQYDCTATSCTTTRIIEQDSLTEPSQVSAQDTTTCTKCGIILPFGLPDPQCYSCTFSDWLSWESWEADRIDPSWAPELSQASDDPVRGSERSFNSDERNMGDALYEELYAGYHGKPFSNCMNYGLCYSPHPLSRSIDNNTNSSSSENFDMGKLCHPTCLVPCQAKHPHRTRDCSKCINPVFRLPPSRNRK